MRSRYLKPAVSSAQSSAFTVIEVTLAIFVLVFGLLGILSLFPVGLNSLKRSVENTNAASVAETAQTHLQLNTALPTSINETIPATLSMINYFQEDATASPARPNVTGTISNVLTDRLTCRLPNGSQPGWGSDAWANATVMITSGAAEGKIYRIVRNTPDQLICNPTGVSMDFEEDEVYAGDSFRIIGWIVWPSGLFAAPGRAVRTFDADIDVVNPGEESQYSFAAIISGWESGMPGLCRVDILIYRNFDQSKPPEENQPPLRHMVTYMGR